MLFLSRKLNIPAVGGCYKTVAQIWVLKPFLWFRCIKNLAAFIRFTIYLERAWELDNYLSKLYCVSTICKCEFISGTQKALISGGGVKAKTKTSVISQEIFIQTALSQKRKAEKVHIFWKLSSKPIQRFMFGGCRCQSKKNMPHQR